MTEEQLIYDWNTRGKLELPSLPPLIVDQTLRASQLSRSARPPALAEQLEIVQKISSLGIHDFCLGTLANPETRLLRSKLSLPDSRFWAEQPNLDALPNDTCCFISQRQKNWSERLKKFGSKATVVVPDVMRCQPAQLHRLLKGAVERKVLGFCLNDDTGRAIPSGTARVVAFARQILDRLGSPMRLEWSGRNDRALALANALSAWRHGATVLHSSFLGIGEGTGLVPTELLLVNLALMGVLPQDLRGLKEVSQTVAAGLDFELHANLPVVGADAFRTGTGVHAAAIIKAQQKGHAGLADLVYSGVPASKFGYHQIIEVGPMAGASNVTHWLKTHGLESSPERVNRILAQAKRSERILTDPELHALATSG